MKKHVIILIFHFLCACTYAQNAIISIDKMNVLYIGVDNPIEFAADKYNCKDLKILTSNMTVKCDDSCKCIANVTTQGIASLVFKNKDDKSVFKISYR